MTFSELDAYRKDLRQLTKRWPALPLDMAVLQKVLALMPAERPPFSTRITGLKTERYVVKVRKIACRNLKGKGSNTGLRLVYAWLEEEQRIVLIELYHKGDQENEDRERIKEWLIRIDKTNNN
jgi:mRNA-degrading endonuclease RelE of RelBE toxin-antitoxin system